MEVELERRILEIQQLKCIVNLKDKQLGEQDVALTEMKRQIEQKIAENKSEIHLQLNLSLSLLVIILSRTLRQRLAQREVEIDAFLEESKKSKRTIELLKYSLKFPPDIDRQKGTNERTRWG